VADYQQQQQYPFDVMFITNCVFLHLNKNMYEIVRTLSKIQINIAEAYAREFLLH